MRKMKEGGGTDGTGLRFVLPVILENSLTIFIGLAFSRVISTISASSLAAIGMANSVMNVVHAFFMMLATGTSVLVSRHTGAGEYSDTARTIEQSLLTTALFSAAAAALCIAAASPLLHLLMPNAEQTLFTEAVRYFRILMLSLPFLELHTMLSGACRAMGNSRVSLRAAILMNVVQLALAYLFIRGAGLEVIGAGLAYVCCRSVGMGFLLLSLKRDTRCFILKLRNILRPDRDRILRILRLGLPIGIENLFTQTGYMLANSMAIALGTFSSGVYQILCTMNEFIGLPQGISIAIAVTLVGQRLGAGDEKGAKRNTMRVWAGSLSATVVIGTAAVLLARTLCGMYTKDASALDLCVRTIWFLPVMDLAGASINAVDTSLRTGGDVKFVMAATLSAVWLIRLPLTWLFCFRLDLGVLGIFLANGVSLLARAVCGMLRFRGRKWIHSRV